MQHRPAPDNRLVSGIEQSHRNYFDPKGFQRLNAVLAHHARLRIHSQHQRNIWPVNIGIEQPNFMPKLRQRHGKIHRQRGLAHASLAGTDRNNGVDARQRLRSLRGRAMLMRYMCVQGITLKNESRWELSDYSVEERRFSAAKALG